jgi:hypothetical protein
MSAKPRNLLLLLSLSLFAFAPPAQSAAIVSETTSADIATDDVYLREKISELEAKISANDLRYEQRFADSEKAVNAALQAADKAVGAALQAAKEAVNKAEAANEKHFDSVNEFRKTLSDQASGFETKDAAGARFQTTDKEISEVKASIQRMEGAGSGQSSLWAALIAAVVAVCAIITVFALISRRFGARADDDRRYAPTL